MGWGIDFKADVYLSRQTYSSRLDVEGRIVALNEDINDIETRLQMYASSTPRDIITEQDVDDSVSWLQFTLKTIFDEYQELLYNRTLLGLYVEYLTENKIDVIKREE